MDKTIQNAVFDYETILNKERELKEKYPFVICHKVGESLCGREIRGYSLGNYKNVVLFVGGISGNDAMTSRLLMKYTEKLCHAFSRRKTISGVNISLSLITKGITVIPCLNPDGLEINTNSFSSAGKYARLAKELSGGRAEEWQSNAQGVDLWRNFNCDREKLKKYSEIMGYNCPSPKNFGGFSGESEPETAALVKFCERNNVDHAFAFTANSDKIGWECDCPHPENSRTMAKILSVCSGIELEKDNFEKEYGSFKNRFMEFCGRSAFSVGIGKGGDIEEIYNNLEEMLVIGTVI